MSIGSGSQEICALSLRHLRSWRLPAINLAISISTRSPQAQTESCCYCDPSGLIYQGRNCFRTRLGLKSKYVVDLQHSSDAVSSIDEGHRKSLSQLGRSRILLYLRVIEPRETKLVVPAELSWRAAKLKRVTGPE